MRVVVVAMRSGDIPDVLAITHAAAALGEQDAQLTATRLEEELARPWTLLWVARAVHDVTCRAKSEGDSRGLEPLDVRSEPVGRTQSRTPRAVGFLLSWHVADELHVLDVGTHADLRRRGVGRALIDAAIEFAREARCAHVLLEVRRSNPAIRLYRACGFSAMGIRAKYYPDNEDAIEMVLAFDPTTREILRGKDEVAT